MTVDPGAAPSLPDLDPTAVSGLLTRGIEACTAWQRTDLAARLRVVANRLSRTSTLVAVIGEYKQGKSMLVNALAGRRVCPVDDDLATAAIIAVYGAEEAGARVRRVVDGRAGVETVPVDDLHRYVTEFGDPVDRAGVELVEVGIPSPSLDEGLTLVDTPGVGGLLQQHTATTLRFLSLADAVIFVTDASQELMETEIAFLEQARVACPAVLVVVTKIDLYPDWRRILEIDRQHLAVRGVDLEPIPVSSALRMEALDRADPDLEQESGIPDLLATIRRQIFEGAKRRSAQRAVDELRWGLSRLLDPIEAELAILDDPDAAEAGLARLRAMHDQLKTLQEAGSRWSTLLNDGFTDLRSEVDYLLRTAVRTLLTKVDTQLEDLDPASDWEGFTHEAQEAMSRVVGDAFAAIDEGVATISDRIAALLSHEEEVGPDLGGTDPLDVMAVWAGTERELKTVEGKRVTGALSTGLTAIRGGSSGMILLGVMGNLAGIALAAPVSVGVAAFFGAKQVMDTRKAALKQRRQEARTVVRQYVDEVNLEVSNRTRQSIQDFHRALRDHYAVRLQELSRSTTTALQTAQESLARDQTGRQERAEKLRQWSTQLRRLLDELPVLDGRDRS
ncbi:MAG: dynamin family protein [Acidimicrobiia bacterium]|nr:dynamin family protein [Acidimicrobiia bacterium]MDH5615825.1 dynamin family protein [Acidimicrobiia bacterium]